MPQLAPMPWITLLTLLFLFKSFIFTSLWSHRPPSFALLPPSSPLTALATNSWPWTN